MAEYLERGLDTLYAGQVVHMRQNLEEVDKMGHPTEHATRKILQVLSAEYGEDIILKEDMPRTRAVSSPLGSLPHLP